MNTIIIAAVNRESGKTVVALGIALNHPGKIDYIKPIRGSLVKVEEEVRERDVYLVHQALGLDGASSEISPLALGTSQGVDADAMVSKLRSLAEGADLEGILKGVHQSLASRVATLAGTLPPDAPVFMSGGVALGQAMVDALAGEPVGLRL